MGSTTTNDNNSSNVEQIDMDKYVRCGVIANAALTHVLQKCIDGAQIKDLCECGENFIREELKKVYTKKEKGVPIEKGICFPVTICVNEICNNHSPRDEETIKEGDLVKVTLGCHIDGHISVVGHTIYVGKEKEAIEGPKADVLKNAHTLAQLMLRSLKPGTYSNDVTSIMKTACEELNCNVIPNCVTYQIKKYILEGSKYILLKENPENKAENFQINTNDIYIIDVMVTTGEGKIKESDHKTTIYKRDIKRNYQLKTMLGRNFMAEVNKSFPVFPFHVTYLEDRRSSLIGIPEALRHELITPYSVYTEKKNEFVAQFKYTVIVREEGIRQITGLLSSQIDQCKTANEIKNPELATLLKTPLTKKKERKV